MNDWNAVDILLLAGTATGLAAMAGIRLALAALAAVLLTVGSVWDVPASWGHDLTSTGWVIGLAIAAVIEIVLDALSPAASTWLRPVRIVGAGFITAAVASDFGLWGIPLALVGAGFGLVGSTLADGLLARSVTAGGHRATLSLMISVGVLVGAGLSAAAPAAGILIGLGALVLVRRFRQREASTYQGLRILS